MAKEIERKFIVADNSFRTMATCSYDIRQCYLSDNPDATVRLRVRGSDSFITVKGRNNGAVRDEWEYPVPMADALEMADRLCGGWAIEKTRYIVDYGGHKWEVDEFRGRHKGLVLAEVELPDVSTPVEIPPFIGEEVTSDPRYYNSVLARKK